MPSKYTLELQWHGMVPCYLVVNGGMIRGLYHCVLCYLHDYPGLLLSQYQLCIHCRLVQGWDVKAQLNHHTYVQSPDPTMIYSYHRVVHPGVPSTPQNATTHGYTVVSTTAHNSIRWYFLQRDFLHDIISLLFSKPRFGKSPGTIGYLFWPRLPLHISKGRIHFTTSICNVSPLSNQNKVSIFWKGESILLPFCLAILTTHVF